VAVITTYINPDVMRGGAR